MHSDQPPYTYLALGDSYTIGESVTDADNFPSQTTAILQKEGLNFLPPRIIAKTGWTTDELEEGIARAGEIGLLPDSYDFVTLLIGVNNQYRGRTVSEYGTAFEGMLQKAIGFAGNRPARVIVISIPDWGITPFAADRNRQQIADEINAFNAVNRKLCLQYQAHYLPITDWTREAATDPSLLAQDGLHPSGKEYRRWAEKLSAYIRKVISGEHSR